MAQPVLGGFRMNVSLYQAAAALDGNIQWQQMIAENLAASSNPGFKKQDISFSTVQAGVLGAGSSDLVAQNHRSFLPAPSISTNFSQGTLRATGNKSDIALEDSGKTIGFLQVQLPDGQIAYTRDGEFHIGSQGQLQNKDGFPLLGEGGGPIQVDPGTPESLSITPTGDISQRDVIRGKFAIFEFASPSQLTRVGSGYYMPKPNVQATPSTGTKIAQGYQEAANTVPTMEMSTLMLALRHFEANQRVIQMQDERMGRLIQELSVTS